MVFIDTTLSALAPDVVRNVLRIELAIVSFKFTLTQLRADVIPSPLSVQVQGAMALGLGQTTAAFAVPKTNTIAAKIVVNIFILEYIS